MQVQGLPRKASAADVPPWLQMHCREDDAEVRRREPWPLLVNDDTSPEGKEPSAECDANLRERSLRHRLERVTHRVRKGAAQSERAGTVVGHQKARERGTAGLSKDLRKGNDSVSCANPSDECEINIVVDGAVGGRGPGSTPPWEEHVVRKEHELESLGLR